MGKKSKLAALALGTFMAMGLACFTACEGAAGKDGKSAYDIWLEQGNTGTEQDFLDSLKGTPGQPGTPGSAPEITVGENGNWFVNGVDTNHKAQGENGQPGSMPEITISDDGYWEINGQKTAQKAQGENGQPGSAPEITISDDGYWEIDGQKTSQKAQGENGQPGKDGKAGNKITHGEGAPTSTEGAIEGDMYVDTKEWNVYFFESGSWKNYGSFNDAMGEDDEPAPSEQVIKDIGELTITSTEQVLDISTLTTDTLYYVKVETDSTTEAKKLYLNAYPNGTTQYGYDMYDSSSTNSYKGAFIKSTGGKYVLKIATVNAETTINGHVSVIKIDIPAIENNKVFDIPLLKSGAGDVKIDISSFVGHKVNVEVTECSASMCSIAKTDSSNAQIVALTKDSSVTTKFTGTFSVESDMASVVFRTTSLRGCNIKLKITFAD